MQNLYSALSNNSEEHEKESAKRLLKRLRIALLIWFLFLIAAVVWFFFGPGF